MLGSVVDNRTFEITAAGGQDKNTAAIFKETNGPPISDTKNVFRWFRHNYRI